MTHTAAILDFVAAPHVLPPAVRADALRLLGDTLAVMAAGAASDEALRVSAALSPQPVRPELVEGLSFPSAMATEKYGPSTSSGQTGLENELGFGELTFHTGFAIHCLEWDAVHEGAVVHALSVVTAALLASSHRAGGCDPEEFLTALAVGVDIASGLGIAATGPMRFFRPATAGVVGAALAVARLEGLNRGQMADVLGLAYSFAGGTMQAHAEASIALPLQIGRAAQAAVQAVELVRAGLTGPHDVLEGPFGYSALIEPLDLTRYTPGAPWRVSEVSIKPFPSGRASHGALGALHQILPGKGRGTARSVVEGAGGLEPELYDANPLRQPSGLPPPRAGEDLLARITAIDLHAPPLIARLVGRPYQPDMTPAYARLCLAFLAPLMLRDGVIDPRTFSPATFTDPAIVRLAAQVRVYDDGNPDTNAMTPQRLVVTLADGSIIERAIPATLGSPGAPMSPEQYAAKYTLCRELAGTCDPRIFDDPLAYATDPK